MSVIKLMSRIITPDERFGKEEMALKMHEQTYGITSDPLAHLAVALSALVHDVDHPGVPNSQLDKEDDPMALRYDRKSVAEQNSVDLAWSLLMSYQFTNLRNAIYRTEVEFRRFRQLVVNTVLATDIMDKELSAKRKERWNAAFALDVDEADESAVNRKATIVIEYIIQASDVAHTMQHWHVYRVRKIGSFEFS